MGKRGKGSPTKVEKPDDNVKGKSESETKQNPGKALCSGVVKGSSPSPPPSGPAKDLKPQVIPQVSIEYKCWRLAEEALSRIDTGENILNEKTISTQIPVPTFEEESEEKIPKNSESLVKSKKNINLDKTIVSANPLKTDIKKSVAVSPLEEIAIPRKNSLSAIQSKTAPTLIKEVKSTTPKNKNSSSSKESSKVTSHVINKSTLCEQSEDTPRLRKKPTPPKQQEATTPNLKKHPISSPDESEYTLHLRKKCITSKEEIESTPHIRKRSISSTKSAVTTRPTKNDVSEERKLSTNESKKKRTTSGSPSDKSIRIASPRLRHQESVRRTLKAELDHVEESEVSKSDKSASPSVRHHRKALTQALQRLRRSSRTPKKLPDVRKVSPLTNICLRKRKPLTPSPEKEKVENLQSHQSEKNLIKMNSTNMNSNNEESGTHSGISNNISPSPESEDQTDPILEDDEDDDDESDSEFEMQVLEKQVESEKEEEDDPMPDTSLNLQDDTDEESSLLSPSALPASQLFRSPSSRKKKRKSLPGTSSLDKGKKQDISSPNCLSSYGGTSYRPLSPEIPSSLLFPTSSLVNTSSLMREPLGALPGKRGRGRPRKTVEEINSGGSMKSYRKKMTPIVRNTDQSRDQNLYNYGAHVSPTDPGPFSQSHMGLGLDEYVMGSGVGQPVNDNVDTGGEPVDPEHFQERLHRWKDRSTFVYARHKFVSNENKFKCDTCQVSFTALSSLKRHYGTIYHKQQEAAGRPTLDLTDILRPDRNGNPAGPTPGPSTSSNYHSGGRGRGRGRPPLARTTSFVRRSAADNIKKYYAAADAARRRRENSTVTATTTASRGTAGFSSTWLQKQQRKRKPLVHADYLYSSASPYSEVDDVEIEDDDFGCENQENAENSSPENENLENGEIYNVNGAIDAVVDSPVETSWLSNVWKGKGPPHFTCEYCGQSFTKKLEFTTHLFQHRQEEAEQMALTCPECAISFPTAQLLDHHFDLFNHGIGVVRKEKQVKKLTCEKCNSKFSRRDYYLKHVEVHRRPLMKCPHCSKRYLYKFYLCDHIKAKHDGWSNNVANGAANGIAVCGGSGMTPGQTPNLISAPSNTTSYIPKPKIELYSSTTTLFPPTTEPIKRKQPNTCSSSGGDTHPLDMENNGISSWRKKSVPPASKHGTPDISVPSFNICEDPFAEKEVFVRDPTDVYEFQDYDDFPSTIEMQSSLSTSSSADQSNKEQVNILQKFFDSQTEEPPQEPEDSMKNKMNIDLETTSATNELPEIGHSTTEDGKIVFQLEHSMFKDFSTMDVGLDENACSMSPLTIEIPRHKINADVEEDKATEMTEPLEKPATEGAQANMEKRNISPPSPSSIARTGDTEKAESLHSTNSNSNSSTFMAASASQLLGCGIKMPNINPQPENELQCQDCGKIFEHRKSLIKHVWYYSQPEVYPCPRCNKSFKLKHHVSRHIKSFHNIDTNSTTSSASDDALLEDHGDMEFLNSLAVQTADGNITATELISEVQSSSAAMEVAAGIRKDQPMASTSAAAMRKGHEDKLALAPDRRKLIVSDPTRRKGDSDTQSSFSKSNYEAIIDSSGATVFKCLICKKLYPSKHQISSHLSYHKRTIPFKCSECEAGFKFKSDLDAHMELHDSEKASGGFVCEKCPDRTSFQEIKDLLKHMREKHHYLGRKVVTSEDPKGHSQPVIRRCPLCPLVFPHESDLRLHMSREHHQKDEFVCHTCGQILGSVESLKEHILSEHQRSNPFKEFGLGQRDEAEGEVDQDQPPVPSPRHSPFNVNAMQRSKEPNDEEDVDLPGGEANPSSPEFELLELN